MQKVSDSFKKAIKSDNREIHGYVEVIYDEKSGEYTTTQIPAISVLSKQDGSDITDNNKIMKNYATLENNYFLLDGSFVLANTNTLYDAGGYISDDIFENIEDKRITLVSSETGYVTTKGFTIFFKDNIPFEFIVNIIINYGGTSDEDESITINVRNNTKRNYQKIFDEEITIKEFTLNITSTEYQDRRIRIPEISFSLTDLYEGDELVDFDVTEEIDLLVESIPIGTCTVNLNNYPDENGNVKFDPINPTGLVQYLTENTILTPYIGVLTEENGIEYVKMGVFYLKDWSSNNDCNVTFNGENLVGRLQNIDISSDGTFLTTGFTGNTLGNYFHNMTGYDFYFISGTYYNNYLRHTNLLDWIKAQMPFQMMNYNSSTGVYVKRKFHITRNNIASEDELIDTVVDTLSRSELKNDVNYETKSIIREVDISDMYFQSETSSTRENIVNEPHTLSETTEYLWFHFDKYVRYQTATFSYSVSSGTGRAELIDANYYMIYVKFTGDVGSVINITYNGFVFSDNPMKVWKWTNNLKTGDTLSLDFHEYFDASDDQLKSSANYYLTEDKKYKVTASTTGDPSLEVGDTISVQTRYQDSNDGYKDIIITKQKFTYDGGLQCELEGRGN